MKKIIVVMRHGEYRKKVKLYGGDNVLLDGPLTEKGATDVHQEAIWLARSLIDSASDGIAIALPFKIQAFCTATIRTVQTLGIVLEHFLQMNDFYCECPKMMEKWYLNEDEFVRLQNFLTQSKSLVEELGEERAVFAHRRHLIEGPVRRMLSDIGHVLRGDGIKLIVTHNLFLNGLLQKIFPDASFEGEKGLALDHGESMICFQEEGKILTQTGGAVLLV